MQSDFVETQKKLEHTGWQVGSAAELLELSAEEGTARKGAKRQLAKS